MRTHTVKSVHKSVITLFQTISATGPVALIIQAVDLDQNYCQCAQKLSLRNKETITVVSGKLLTSDALVDALGIRTWATVDSFRYCSATFVKILSIRRESGLLASELEVKRDAFPCGRFEMGSDARRFWPPVVDRSPEAPLETLDCQFGVGLPTLGIDLIQPSPLMAVYVRDDPVFLRRSDWDALEIIHILLAFGIRRVGGRWLYRVGGFPSRVRSCLRRVHGRFHCVRGRLHRVDG